jgi:23S rRNA (guanosine2251-2'-O)-methyltransferase
VWRGDEESGTAQRSLALSSLRPGLTTASGLPTLSRMEHLEGRQSVLAALKARQRRFEVILVSHGAHVEKLQEVLDTAAELGVPVRQADGRELDAMAHGVTHGGILAVVSAKPRANAEQLLEIVDALREPPLLLLLEGIEDARNLGFTLRSAEALGAHAVLIKKHLWDLDGVEIARPASGAYERLPLAQIESVEPLQKLQQRGLRLYGCIAGARRTLYETDLAGPSIIGIGGEKRGLSGAVRSICDGFLSIPTRGQATSLSLSHAASVVMAEAMRQRWKPGRAEKSSDGAEQDG